MTFLKSSRWKLQATPPLPVPAPPYPTLLDSTSFSKKPFGAWKFRPSSGPPGIWFPPVCCPLSGRPKPERTSAVWRSLDWGAGAHFLSSRFAPPAPNSAQNLQASSTLTFPGQSQARWAWQSHPLVKRGGVSLGALAFIFVKGTGGKLGESQSTEGSTPAHAAPEAPIADPWEALPGRRGNRTRGGWLQADQPHQ